MMSRRSDVSAFSIFSPAKLNLFLAITGRRSDGFHDLVSVVAPVAWGDTLTGKLADDFSLECDDPAVPLDDTNLVLKAARMFREASGWDGGVRFRLEKKIPIGAGLGGGSSNGAAALRTMNALSGERLSHDELISLAGRLGSDCALFLHQRAVVMRGRGERVAALPAQAARRLSERRVLIFKPGFGISTPWAYGQMVGRAEEGDPVYLSADEAEARLGRWIAAEAAPAEELLFNNMESVAFAKFRGLPVMLDELKTRFGVHARMSGSGSACFTLLEPEVNSAPIVDFIRAAWGPSVFLIESVLG
jgi:4-diphosphocytidyl-2-C-methyl-D-erythritol kinase